MLSTAILRRVALGVVLSAAPVALHAQASAYIPLDDPRLPTLEHLIERGDIVDPSPMVRPFRRIDAVRALQHALDDSSAHRIDEALAERLIAYYADIVPNDSTATWYGSADVGFQSYTQGRRDLLYQGGPGKTRPYADGFLRGSWGPVVIVSRLAIENRLRDDPDWTGSKTIPSISPITVRAPEAYASSQWKAIRLFYGQMDRNWGPSGVYGLAVSNYRYANSNIGFEFHTKVITFQGMVYKLQDQVDSIGQNVTRNYLAHRLDVQVTKRLRLGVWETSLIASRDNANPVQTTNPLTAIRLLTSNGFGDAGNQMVGVDGTWRMTRTITTEFDFNADELSTLSKLQPGAPHKPNRLSYTLSFRGPIGRDYAWRLLYTGATSLVYRTFDPQENIAESGVGLGRNWGGNKQYSLFVSRPVGVRWLARVEGTYLRQDSTSLRTPFPANTQEALGTYPEQYYGTIQSTLRGAVAVTGRQGPVTLDANVGVNRITNFNNVPGVNATKFVAKVQATIGIRGGGRLGL